MRLQRGSGWSLSLGPTALRPLMRPPAENENCCFYLPSTNNFMSLTYTRPGRQIRNVPGFIHINIIKIFFRINQLRSVNNYFQYYLLTGKNIRKRNLHNCTYCGSIITKCNITVVGKIYHTNLLRSKTI